MTSKVPSPSVRDRLTDFGSHARAWVQRYYVPLLVAALAWIYVMCHLDPAGSYPNMPEGPGLTIDETFNVQQGVVMVEAIRQYGIGLLSPSAIKEVFSPPLHLPDHPPLGRLWLGVHHHLVWAIAPPANEDELFVTACARAGSATAFALTILLVGCCCTAWYGDWAGLMATLGFAVLPRLLGHAHLAALETITNLTYTAAVLSVVAWWDTKSPPTMRTAAITGIFFGLALLTKIQAVMIPIPMLFVALIRWRRFGIPAVLVWGLTGLAVFFIGWPWLWLDPVGHFLQYVRGATDRAAVSVWFCGTKYTDQTVPWYYAFAYFWWTVPFKLHIMAYVGCFGTPSEPVTEPIINRPYLSSRVTFREVALMLNAFWPLCFFSLPGISVYDCERLFLPAIPLWLVIFGRGSEFLLKRLQGWWKTGGPLICYLVIGITLVQILSLNRFYPSYLSYYSGTALGMSGAMRGNYERNYWGDAINRTLLEELTRKVPRDTTVAMSPVLHQFQCEEYWRQSPILKQHGIRFTPYTTEGEERYLLLFRRLADLPPELHGDPEGWELLAENEIDDMQLAALYRRKPGTLPAPVSTEPAAQ
ncbi:hypothetical protein GC163_01765 [bacterium]|nr:hypothetical protein [bacterium]